MGRGIDMMSTAILMKAGAEQTKASLASADPSSDQAEPEGISFAKSFHERVGVSVLSEGKSAADMATMALQSVRNATPMKKSDGVADLPAGVKAKDIVVREISAHNDLKSAVVCKIIQPQAKAVTETQEQPAASDSERRDVGQPAQAEEAVDDVSSTSPAPCATPVSGPTDESLVRQVGIVIEDRPLVSRAGEPTVQKETETAAKVMEGLSSKKGAKMQENAGTSKTVQKTVGRVVNVVAVQANPVAGSSAESTIPVVGQAVAPTVAFQSEISKATNVFSKAVNVVAKPSTGVPSTTVDGLVRKEVPSGTKTSAMDVEMAVTAGSDLVASTKTGTNPEKMSAVAMPGGSDSENRPQAAPGPSAGLLHSLGIAPAAVVFGNTPGELVATKLPVGDAGAQAAGLTARSREQDGAGVVAQSMDGAPRVLAATPTSLEVGIQNGTHGWLKVRAEMTDGGVVNASVSAASSAGQEMLHRELPALSAYLQEEKVAVNAVIVHAPSAAGTDARSSSGTDGAGGQTPQRSNEGEQQHQSLRKTTLNVSEETMPYRSLHGVDEDGSLPLAAYVNGGSWLSVRA
jgi:hypothetical protein